MMEAAYPSGLQPLLEKIDRLRAEIDKLRPLSPEQEARVMQKFRLDWNFHSNSIEGNSLTYGETIAFLMEGLTAKGKPFKDHLDIKGHNEGIDYLMEIIKNRQHLTEKAIRELHKIILVEPYKTPAKTPDGQAAEKTVHLGQYKSLPNHVKTPTGEIHYYATPEETPAKMSDLMAWLQEHQEKKDLHPVMLAAIFHYRFVAIHPFDDGNGRMSRLLMNLLLMHYHYPPVVIKQQERNAYYYALRQADAGDLSPFIEFIGENLIHSMEIYLRGARGESIEETDDLDKEIALLKGSLGIKKSGTPKSEDLVRQLLAETFFPFLQETQSQYRKLNDLFFRNNDWILFSLKGKAVEFSNPNWDEIRINWLYGNGFWEIYPELQNVKYEYHWIDFRKAEEPFRISSKIIIHFHQFEYEINFDGLHEKIKITKTYSEKLSKEEINYLSKIFLKEAIEQIKAKTGK